MHLSGLLLQAVIVQLFHTHDADFLHQMSPSEWKALRGTHAILEFGRGASTLLQSESLVVISIAWLAMSLFSKNSINIKKILKPNSTNFDTCQHHDLHSDARRVGKALNKDLEARCGAHKITDIEKNAMVLDPRTKDLKSSWCPFDSEEREECWTLADSLVKAIAKNNHKAGGTKQATTTQHKRQDDLLEDAFSALHDDDDDGILEFEAGQFHPELQDWRANGVCVGTKKITSFYPLNFWRERREGYQSLHLAAMLVLGGMASAARVEMTWSVVGHVLDDLCNRLKPEMLGMLIFIKRNWPLLLHEVQRKRSYMSKGKKVDVEQTVMEVNVDEMCDLYVSMFGKNLAAEKAKRAATAKKRKAPDVNVNEEEKDTTVSVEEVVANTTSPESAGPSRERATTRQSASEARMNEAADFIAQFNADPTQYGQCSVWDRWQFFWHGGQTARDEAAQGQERVRRDASDCIHHDNKHVDIRQ